MTDFTVHTRGLPDPDSSRTTVLLYSRPSVRSISTTAAECNISNFTGPRRLRSTEVVVQCCKHGALPFTLPPGSTRSPRQPAGSLYVAGSDALLILSCLPSKQPMRKHDHCPLSTSDLTFIQIDVLITGTYGLQSHFLHARPYL